MVNPARDQRANEGPADKFEQGHTPGPWTVNVNNIGVDVVADSMTVAMTCSPTPNDHAPICHANARLIAAAPDMLAALTVVEAVMTIVPPRSDTAEYLEALDKVRAAIAKAEGRS